MSYVKSVVVLSLLGVGSNAFSMEESSLKSLAARSLLVPLEDSGQEEIREDVLKELDLTDKEGKRKTPLDVSQLVGAEYCKANFSKTWEHLPEKTTLLERAKDVRIRGIEFIGDSSIAVSTDSQGYLKWWDTNNIRFEKENQPPTPYMVEAGHSITMLAVSGDGKILISAGDTTVKLWDAVYGKPVATLQHDEEVFSIACNHDASEIVVGGRLGAVWVWKRGEPSVGRKLEHVRLEPRLAFLNKVHAVGLSPDGKRIYSAVDRSIKVWDKASGQCLKELTLPNCSIIGKMRFVGDKAFTYFTDGKMIKTDLDKGTHQTIKLTNVGIESGCMDGRFFVAGCQDGAIRLWELKDDKYDLIREFTGEFSYITYVAMRDDQETFLSGNNWGCLDMWSIHAPMNTITYAEAKETLSKKRKIEPQPERRVMSLKELRAAINGGA